MNDDDLFQRLEALPPAPSPPPMPNDPLYQDQISLMEKFLGTLSTRGVGWPLFERVLREIPRVFKWIINVYGVVYTTADLTTATNLPVVMRLLEMNVHCSHSIQLLRTAVLFKHRDLVSSLLENKSLVFDTFNPYYLLRALCRPYETHRTLGYPDIWIVSRVLRNRRVFPDPINDLTRLSIVRNVRALSDNIISGRNSVMLTSQDDLETVRTTLRILLATRPLMRESYFLLRVPVTLDGMTTLQDVREDGVQLDQERYTSFLNEELHVVQMQYRNSRQLPDGPGDNTLQMHGYRACLTCNKLQPSFNNPRLLIR